MTNRRNPIAHLCLALSCTALLGVGAAQQQLTRLAPPDATLVVTLQTGTEFAPELSESLSRLDWQGAGETLEKLMAVSDNGSMSGDLAELTDISGLRTGLEELCPTLPDEVERLFDDGMLSRFDAMLTVQPRLFNVPVTVVARFDGLAGAGWQSLDVALDSCSDETRSFEEIGAPGTGRVYRFSAGQNGLYIALSDSGLLVFGRDLGDSVMPVLNRAAGATTPSLADSDPFSAFQPAEGYSLGVALLADPILERFGDALLGSTAGEDEMAAAVRNALDTLDAVAWRGTLTPEGLLNELSLAIDPDRPDADLARLILCEGCARARPYLAPADALSFSSAPLPLNRLIDYVDGFLAATGEVNGISDLLQSELGLTVEPNLLEALGEGAYMYTLETIGTDLATLLYQPGRVLVVPVSSAETARSGLDSLLGSLQSLAAGAGPTLPLAVREAEYRGVDYRRVQASANIDLGIGLVGSNLVVGLPSKSIETAIDTYLGGRSLVGSERYRRLVAEVPQGAHGLSFQDTSATLSGVADLLRLASQPLAFVANLAIAESQESTDFAAPVPDELGGSQVLLPDELQALRPGVTEAELSDEGDTGDHYVAGDLSDVYAIEGIAPGDELRVVMESQALDTMLYLLDDAGNVLDSNDDAPDTSRSELVFAAEAGRNYVIQATSFWGDGTGEYTLALERATGEGAAPTSRPEPQPLSEGTTSGDLGSTDVLVEDKLSDLYRLADVRPGENVTVAVESDSFDTMLYLRDASGRTLQSNDDAPDTSRSELQFAVEEGAVYEIQVTSYWGDGTGPYTLSVGTESLPEAAEAEPPGFAELLALFELPAELFEALAENTGDTTGYAVSSGGTLYSRGVTELR